MAVIFKYKNKCSFIGFTNVSRANESGYDGFENAVAYLDEARGGDITVSEEVFCVRCNAGRNVSALVISILLSADRIERQDMWGGYSQHLVGIYECPECKKKGKNETYLFTKEAKSDMQRYGYKGANYGC